MASNYNDTIFSNTIYVFPLRLMLESLLILLFLQNQPIHKKKLCQTKCDIAQTLFPQL